MDYRTQYVNTPVSGGEPGGGEKIVDSSGYVTAEQQIFSMIDAGIRLDQARREMYDYEGSEDDSEENLDLDSVDYDRLRIPGIDIAEVSQMQLAIKARLKRQQEYADKLADDAKRNPVEKPEVE